MGLIHRGFDLARLRRPRGCFRFRLLRFRLLCLGFRCLAFLLESGGLCLLLFLRSFLVRLLFLPLLGLVLLPEPEGHCARIPGSLVIRVMPLKSSAQPLGSVPGGTSPARSHHAGPHGPAAYLFAPRCLENLVVGGIKSRRTRFTLREKPADVLETRVILIFNDPAYEIGRGLSGPTVLQEDSSGRFFSRRV